MLSHVHCADEHDCLRAKFINFGNCTKYKTNILIEYMEL